MNVVTDADLPHLLQALETCSREEASSLLASMPFDLEDRRRRYDRDPIYKRFLR